MEILEQFKKQLEGVDFKPELEQTGEVIEIKDGVATVSGLKDVENFEIVKFEGTEIFGLVLNLEEYETGIVVLGDEREIKEGDVVKRTNKVFSVPVGESLLGRTLDPLGRPVDGKGEITSKEFLPLERKGPSVIDREPVSSPMHSGIKVIDALIPVGRGQRQLILGDRSSGKTAIALDFIINQKKEDKKTVCIYVGCGQKKKKIKRLVKTLEEEGAIDYTIVVSASPDSPASYIYLAPFTGVTLGEYFRDRGDDVLVVFDDLTKQAWAWREISLVLRRPPGREAYPGDIFYLHSRLLERAAKLSKENKGGSLTALPIIETQGGDMSGYIPTNVISICDGQIFLDSTLFRKGQKPAIDIGKSVSRVGSSAQTKAMKKVSGTLKLDLAQFEELERFSEFTEELDPKAKQTIEKGKRIREILKQNDLTPLSVEKEVLSLFVATKSNIEEIPFEKVGKFVETVIKEVEIHNPKILEEIRKGDFSEDNANQINKTIKEVKKSYGS